MKTIGEVAALAGVSVRTLRYYDQIGLLCPQTTPAGYRMYSEADLERLWQILFFRELAFPLGQIRAMLSSPAFAREDALAKHRRLLCEKRKRIDAIITSIDDALTKGFEEKMLKTFDSSGIEQAKREYAEEAGRLYGDTYRQSAARTAGYTKTQWQAILSEAQAIYDKLAACMAKGPASPAAQALIGAWRDHITAHYYDCMPDIFRGLGELYVQDARFTKNIDKTAPGLAAFMSEAIAVYCKKLG